MQSKNVKVLGASYDSVEENKAFAEKFSFPFQLLCDTSREIAERYGAKQEGAKADYAARIAYIIDESGKIAQVFPKVDVNSFAADVLAHV